MSQSKDVSAANAISALPKSPEDDDELERLLEEALTMDLPVAVPAQKDCVLKHHEFIRRALVDWGDEIVDILVARFEKLPKIVAHIEEVRKEVIDPLRDSLV